MRRYAYPYGRYLIKDKKISDMGEKIKDFIANLGFPIIKYDTKNDRNGTLIIAVNKKVRELMKQKKPPGYIEMILREFPIDIASFREMDLDSQRVGIELYLWPLEEGILLEIFILPYMEHFNKKEIFRITESKKEEITDWILCEQIWDYMIPKINTEFKLEPLHSR